MDGTVSSEKEDNNVCVCVFAGQECVRGSECVTPPGV